MSKELQRKLDEALGSLLRHNCRCCYIVPN